MGIKGGVMAKSLIQKISFCVGLFFFIFSFFPAFSNIETIHRQWACCQSLSYDKKNFAKKVALAVYRENSKIMKARTFVLGLVNKKKQGSSLTFQESQHLCLLFSHYRTNSMVKLLERMDIVPISLALAQAIEESGWGKSSSARKKNSCFGMRKRGGSMIFVSLEHCVSSYIDNFNRHRAYENFRKYRKKAREMSKVVQGVVLVQGLRPYCEAASYPTRICYIIGRLNLSKFDGVMYP
jgi:Bax protein